MTSTYKKYNLSSQFLKVGQQRNLGRATTNKTPSPLLWSTPVLTLSPDSVRTIVNCESSLGVPPAALAPWHSITVRRNVLFMILMIPSPCASLSYPALSTPTVVNPALPPPVSSPIFFSLPHCCVNGKEILRDTRGIIAGLGQLNERER